GLRILALMSNSGLPEAGDAVMTLPLEYLTDRETYLAATTLTDREPDLAATTLTDRETYLAATTTTVTDPTATTIAEVYPTATAVTQNATTSTQQNARTRSAIARRDLALEGYAVLRERYEAEGPSALEEFYAAAVRIVQPQLVDWRQRWEQGAR